MSIVMKFRAVGVELFRADRQMDREVKDNIRFYQFYERAAITLTRILWELNELLQITNLMHNSFIL